VTTPTAVLLVDEAGGQPVDAARLAELAARAWYWPEAAAELARVASAVPIASPPAPGPIEAALALTSAVAARAREPGVVAVVWEPTGLVHEAASFADQAEDASREDLPLYLWVRFEGTKGPDGTLGMRTTGLASLGGMEVEVEGSQRDGEHILECVTDVALFVLTSESIPEDGETIEVTRGELRVRRMKSLRGDGTLALRVRV
jgi:hypothetical protein